MGSIVFEIILFRVMSFFFFFGIYLYLLKIYFNVQSRSFGSFVKYNNDKCDCKNFKI